MVLYAEFKKRTIYVEIRDWTTTLWDILIFVGQELIFRSLPFFHNVSPPTIFKLQNYGLIPFCYSLRNFVRRFNFDLFWKLQMCLRKLSRGCNDSLKTLFSHIFSIIVSKLSRKSKRRMKSRKHQGSKMVPNSSL